MCKFITLTVVGLFIASSASAAPPVTVQKNPDGSGWASACSAAVLESGGNLGCITVDGLVFCTIREAGGEQAFCSSSDPEHVAAVRGMPDNCGLFMTFDANGSCTTIMTATGTNSHP